MVKTNVSLCVQTNGCESFYVCTYENHLSLLAAAAVIVFFFFLYFAESFKHATFQFSALEMKAAKVKCSCRYTIWLKGMKVLLLFLSLFRPYEINFLPWFGISILPRCFCAKYFCFCGVRERKHTFDFMCNGFGKWISLFKLIRFLFFFSTYRKLYRSKRQRLIYF